MSSNISIFSHSTQTTGGKIIPFDVFLENIRDGKWQDYVLPIRAMKAKEERTKAKKKVPYVTLTGVFNERNNKGLKTPSGFIGIDIDDVDPEEVKSILGPDRYVYSIFTSISGRGVCVIFRINPDKHAEAFEGIQEYLYTNYQLVIDSAARDLSRPRFISYDPHIYINERADKFAIYPKKQKALTKVPTVVYVQSDFDAIIKEIVTRRIDITGDYHTWLRIAYGLADKFGEGGRSYFHDLSQFSHLYKPLIADKQYSECLKNSQSNKRATISTVYYLAKQAGIQIQSEQTKLIATTASLAKKGRRTKEDTLKLLQEAENIAVQEAQDIVNQVFENNIQVNTEDNPIEALETWLRQNYQLRRNIITRYIENSGRQLQSKDFNTIYVAGKKVFEKLTYEMLDRVINSDFTPDYNPLLDFFEKHSGRRPVGAIAALFKTIETDTGTQGSEFFPDYAEYFGKKWLVGMISFIYGTHSPLMLVLSGAAQNTGKTEWWRRLLPRELRSYYAESKLDAGKDDDILMTQKLLIMDDEMGGKSKKDEKRLKELLSKQTFSLREPYGRNNVDLQRLAVLGGTSNENEILSDPTGNRRIIPINVLSINHDAYNAIDKTDLLMEAYHLYHSGFKWELNKDDVKILNQNTGYFEQSSPEFDLLSRHFELPKHENDMLSCFLTATEIKAHLEARSGQKLNPTRLGMELKKAGYQRIHKKINGASAKGYQVIKVDR
jgi:predicted P-loop ATPase